MLENLLSEPRRKFLAGVVMDVVKFVAGAGVVSGFLPNFPLAARVFFGVLFLVLFVVAWVLYPAKGGR